MERFGRGFAVGAILVAWVLVFDSPVAGIAARGSQNAAGTVRPEARELLNALTQRLDRVAQARERGERFDIRDFDAAPLNVMPLIGVSRQALVDALGAPSVDCRRTRIAPCRAENDLVYSLYVLPKFSVGGGPELLLEFDGGEKTVRAGWVYTQ